MKRKIHRKINIFDFSLLGFLVFIIGKDPVGKHGIFVQGKENRH
jgi:hypothetical protein